MWESISLGYKILPLLIKKTLIKINPYPDQITTPLRYQMISLELIRKKPHGLESPVEDEISG